MISFGDNMTNKLSYEELEKKVQVLEQVERDRLKVDKAFRESEDRFLSLFKTNHAIMLIINPDTGDH